MRPAIFALGCAMLLALSARAEPAHEPSIREVLSMAKQAAGSLGPERTRALCKRARLSGLVPSVRLTSRRGLQQDTSSSSSITSDRTNASLGDDLTLEASLSFDLARLVFASEEVRLLSVERWLVNDLRKFLEEVTRLYFQRRRLLAERAVAVAPDAELDTQIAELEALLDAFTDGAFARALPQAAPSSVEARGSAREQNKETTSRAPEPPKGPEPPPTVQAPAAQPASP